MNPLSDFIRFIESHRELGPEVVHHEAIPPRPARWGEVPAGLASEVRQGLVASGISRLYLHQARAVELALAGKDLVVVTPTASGKTLCYNLPVLGSAARDPNARALYIFPMKALEQDQLSAFRELAKASGLSSRVKAEIYDGDTKSHLRAKIRKDPPSVIITNPDMLHQALLPYHEKWEKFFSSLRFVVLDEVHAYRGVFGSHVANVLRRLFRVAGLYGSRPQVIACSGTIHNPGELVSKLTSREVEVVDENGAPAAGRHFLFLNPERLSASTVAARLLREAVRRDLATIVFTKARKITELIYTWTVQADPSLRRLISAYRAGYLPEERREIEHNLFTGKMKGVVSTSALEMGIDIGGLDVCVLVGYPGAITTTWQRGGRVGRQDRESLIVLVAGRDALDQFFMKHPRAFFDRGFEPAVINPGNLPILKDHLACAAAEWPLSPEEEWFAGPEMDRALSELADEGRVVKGVEEGVFHSVKRYPQREVNIRGVGESHAIFEEPRPGLPPEKKPRVIGSLDGVRVFSEGHPGAIYLHRAEQYQVTRLDLAKRNLYARPVRVNYYTMPRKEKDTTILSTWRSKPVRNFVARLGELEVKEQVIGYEKKRISNGERISVHELDLPPYYFQTVGFWMEIDDFAARAVARARRNFMGGIHAVEHAAIALFPLFALCEADDVGGISTPFHPQAGKAAIFIYDGYPGGVGLAEQCFERLEDLLEQTLSVIRECDCEEGCPACIYSAKCGSGNVPLDKQAAFMVLSMLLDKEEAKKWILAGAGGKEQEEFFEPEAEAEAEEDKKEQGPRVMVLDLETRRSAEEVGGWGNAHLMGLALAVVWDSRTGKFFTFKESEVPELLALLKKADLVVGFNLLRFDYRVLSAYDDSSLGSLPTFDLLQAVGRKLGFRVALSHLTEHTLNAAKSADGLQSLEWVKQGRLDLVEEYCKKDVELTRDLFYHVMEKGYIRYKDREGRLMELRLDWNLEELVEKAAKSSK